MKKFLVFILTALVLLTFMVYRADACSCKSLDYVRVFGSDIVDENSTNQYTARAYFSDGSSQDVTELATWNLSSPVHSTLSQTGVLTVYDVEETGYCRVSAFYNFKCCTCCTGTTKSGYKDVTVLPQGQWPPL